MAIIGSVLGSFLGRNRVFDSASAFFGFVWQLFFCVFACFPSWRSPGQDSRRTGGARRESLAQSNNVGGDRWTAALRRARTGGDRAATAFTSLTMIRSSRWTRMGLGPSSDLFAPSLRREFQLVTREHLTAKDGAPAFSTSPVRFFGPVKPLLCASPDRCVPAPMGRKVEGTKEKVDQMDPLFRTGAVENVIPPRERTQTDRITGAAGPSHLPHGLAIRPASPATRAPPRQGGESPRRCAETG